MRRSLLVLGLATSFGCSRAKPADPPIAAEGSGVRILRSEVDEKGAARLLSLKVQENQTRREILNDMLYDLLLKKEAESRHLTTTELLKAEIQYDKSTPDSQQIEMIYRANLASLGNRSPEEARQQVINAVLQRREDDARVDFSKRLFKKWGVRIHLPPPKVDLKVPSDAPSLGPAKAAVTLVEYADYQCPFCQRAEERVESLLQKNPNVRFVLLDFPLDRHSQALPAAEAAHCAADQGKFFEYRHNLLATPGEFSEADLLTRADSLKLNLPSFKECLTTKRHEADVKRSFDEAIAAGVSVTPTFFVNGRVVEGMVSDDQLQELIDAALAGN